MKITLDLINLEPSTSSDGNRTFRTFFVFNVQVGTNLELIISIALQCALPNPSLKSAPKQVSPTRSTITVCPLSSRHHSKPNISATLLLLWRSGFIAPQMAQRKLVYVCDNAVRRGVDRRKGWSGLIISSQVKFIDVPLRINLFFYIAGRAQGRTKHSATVRYYMNGALGRFRFVYD